MRPRYLEIEGLQSFKDLQIVDFDKLGETGLFGIFGPTGSGKSSILDAITLALYGNVQRAVRGTQGIANTDRNTVRVSFVFDLLKNGERKTYRVERAYRRKKSSDNSIEVKVARLFEVEGEEDRILADKPGEVNQKIIELIGLQDDDFTRSVVLPQNKFQEFLMMDKSRKRDMMERIFYLEEYGRNLTEKVAKKLSAVRYRLSNIEGAISTLGELSETTLVELESSMQKIREDRDTIDGRLKAAEIRFHEAKEIWELQGDLQEVAARESKINLQRPDMEEKGNVLELAQKAAEIEPILVKYIESEKSLKGTLQHLETICNQIPLASCALKQVRVEYDKAREEAEQQKPRLIEQRTRLHEAAGIALELKVMESQLQELREQYKGCKAAWDQQTREAEAKKGEIEKAEASLEKVKQDAKGIEVDPDHQQQVQGCVKLEEELEFQNKQKDLCSLRAEELSRRVEGTQAELNQLEAQTLIREEEFRLLEENLRNMTETCPGSREEILREGEEYHRLKALVETLKHRMRERDVWRLKGKEVEEEIQREEEEKAGEELRKQKLQEECQRAKEKLEGLRKSKEVTLAAQLAVTLAMGTPCPVCGSLEHPAPAHRTTEGMDTGLEEKLQQAQHEVEGLEKSLQEVETRRIQWEVQLRNQRNQQLQLQKELELKEKECAEAADKLPEEMRSLPQGELEEYLENNNRRREEKLQALEVWEKEKAEIEAKRMHLQQRLSQQRTEGASRQGELYVNRENLLQIQKELELAKGKVEEISERYTLLLRSLEIENAREELSRLDQNRRKALLLQKQIADSETNIKSLRNLWGGLEEQRQKQGEELYEVRTQGEVLRVRKEEMEKKLMLLTGGGDIESELCKVEEKLQSYEQQEVKLQTQVKEQEGQLHALESQQRMLENQRNIYSEGFRSEEKRLQTALQEKGFESAEAAKGYILIPEERERLKAELNAFQEMCNNLQAQKQLLTGKLKGRFLAEEEWQSLQGGYEQLKQEKEQSIAAYENAKSVYTNYQKSFGQWVVMDRERQSVTRKKELLEQIQRLLKGNSFIEFISEERLRYIAREASETLGVLTKFRYSLELDTENGFVIRDNGNGGVCRSVSSLSGGETFLTSLSLALALSSQIQLKGQSPLEFFFLDEGFGTLDEELLNTVIDSLERLSSTKKVIGVISHVPELKNRIARRLIVEPPSSDGSGSRVRLEKA